MPHATFVAIFWSQIQGSALGSHEAKEWSYAALPNKDIHLVPVQFLFYDPEMLRNYGGRVLMLNMNNPDTRDAFSFAMETPMDT